MYVKLQGLTTSCWIMEGKLTLSAHRLTSHLSVRILAQRYGQCGRGGRSGTGSGGPRM